MRIGPVLGRARRRLLPAPVVAVVLVVLVVAVSERTGGPVTVGALRDRIAAATGVAADADAAAPGEIHLTFDDGPTGELTPEILDLLAAHDATAVFFPVGSQVDGGADLLRRAVAEGHRIGNHTWNHETLSGISATGFDDAVGRTQVAVVRATGVEPRCLRPPGGRIDAATEERADRAGLRVQLWTVDPQDWRQPGVRAIVDDVVDGAADGDVVLLHDGGGAGDRTVRALEAILERLGERGWRFTAIPGC